MSHNSFGHLFRITTFGESHGVALGCVVDGCPPGFSLTEADIQSFLDKRKPGQNRFTTQRREPDQVKILSGVFEDDRTGGQVTTGTPIALMIENVDQRSKDYSEIRDKFRPGHADFTYDGEIRRARLSRWRAVFGARDRCARGGRGGCPQGRAASHHPRRPGADGPAQDQPGQLGLGEVDNNPFFCPDAEAAKAWEAYLDGIRKAGSSCGAVIEVVASACRQVGVRRSMASSTRTWHPP
jgi:chorismate synthase